MQLDQLLSNASGIRQVNGETRIQIRAICIDSRQVQPGDLFVAVRGAVADGHAFITKAIENGAIAIIFETLPTTADWAMEGKVVFIHVEDSADVLGHLASAFNSDPSHRVKLVGVTGTNGKTTVTTLLWQCFTRLGYKCGLIGTVENRIGDLVVPSTHTTPDAIHLQGLLAKMVEAECAFVFLEASSHAIDQRRVAGCRFVGTVFTNLTHDHLDYHGTFTNYRDAKKRLFDDLTSDAFALTNSDDRNGEFMLQNTQARKRTFSLKKSADYKVKILDNALTGLHLSIDNTEIHARQVGSFNAYNLVAVYGVARELGIEKTAALTAISDLGGAEGRFESIVANGITGIVDYAHTPDALQQVLETITQLRKKGSRILTVVGCGGDRDKTKRPVMAKTAAHYSDQAILTSDNPRMEDPTAILHDMEQGLDKELEKKTLVIESREQAIKTASRMAQKGDIILVAGKGHEKYQEINGVKHEFDDKAILYRCLTE